MKSIKAILKWIPEIYLMLSVIYYWIDTGLFNPFAITFFLTLSLLLYFKNKIMGIIISTLFIVINLYLILALLSDVSSAYRRFAHLDNRTEDLLFFGSFYIGLNIVFGVMMFLKYIKSNKQADFQMSV